MTTDQDIRALQRKAHQDPQDDQAWAAYRRAVQRSQTTDLNEDVLKLARQVAYARHRLIGLNERARQEEAAHGPQSQSRSSTETQSQGDQWHRLRDRQEERCHTLERRLQRRTTEHLNRGHLLRVGWFQHQEQAGLTMVQMERLERVQERDRRRREVARREGRPETS